MARPAFLVSLLALSAASQAFAQVALEIQPFIGYRFGGKIRPGGDAPELPSLDLRSSRSQGVSAMVTVAEGRWLAGGEFMWNRQPTRALDVLEGATGPLRIDQYLIHGMIGRASGETNRELLPFVLFGAGVTSIAGLNPRYAYTFGGGVRYFFTNLLGIRLQARFAPIHLFTTDQKYTVIYEPGTPSGTERYREAETKQGELTLGLIFRVTLRPRR